MLQLQPEQGSSSSSSSNPQGPFCRNPARAALAAACCAGAGFAPGPAGPATRRSRQRALESCLQPSAAGEEPTLELGAEEGGAEEYIAPPPPDAMRLLRLLSLDDADLPAASGSYSSSSSVLGERPISRACELRALRLLWAAVAAEVAASAQQLLQSPCAVATAAAAPAPASAAGWAALASAAFPSWTLAEQAAAIRAALQADGDAAVAEAAVAAAAEAGCAASVQGAGGGEDLPVSPWDGLLPQGEVVELPPPGDSVVAATSAAGADAAGAAAAAGPLPVLSRAKRLCALQYRRGRLAALLRHLCYVAAMLAVAAGEPAPDWARASVQ